MKTPLYLTHIELGAKMAPFAGWDMPLWYTTPTEEHLAVRNHAGLFDVSHMAVFEVLDEKELEWLTPTLFRKKEEGSVTYTFLMNEKGGVLDDVLVYKWSSNRFWIVANASNRDRVFNHLTHFLAVKKVDVAILALQGREAEKYQTLPEHMHFISTEDGVVISGTGYTGEKGCEVFLPPHLAAEKFQEWIKKGVTPCGLASRDSLRLEKGFALWGHELSDSIAPEESVSSWVLKKRDTPYLGQGKLPKKREAIAFKLEEGIARESAILLKGEKEVGVVTSGTFSPCLKCGIGLGLVTELPDQVMIRGKKMPLNLITLPFV